MHGCALVIIGVKAMGVVDTSAQPGCELHLAGVWLWYLRGFPMAK